MKFRLILTGIMMLAGLFTACDILDPQEEALLVPPTVDEDASLPAIEVNGTRLHAETFGSENDPMLVVIHGGPGSDYRSLLNCSRFAADGFFVVFYDQRGSGLSRRHDDFDYTPQSFVDDLDAVIAYYRQSAQQEVFLLGHSWGAMLAAAYINQHVNDISGAVLSEPGGFTWEDTEDYISRWQKMGLFDETTNDMVWADQFVTGDDHQMLDYKGALMSTDHLVGDAETVPFWRFGAVCNRRTLENAMDHGFDFRPHLDEFTAPVLFAYSELNTAYGRAHAEKVSSAFADVQLVEIPGSGHDIPYFGWDAYYTQARAYLCALK